MAFNTISTEIKRKEGDTTDIVITVPVIIALTDYTEIIFQVNKNAVISNLVTKGAGDIIFVKSLTGGGITVDGQVITVTFGNDSTKGHSGSHYWELECSNGSSVIHTIGEGDFILTRELIKH